MKTLISTLTILVVTNIFSYYIGSHSFIWGTEVGKTFPTPYVYNTEEALKSEREYCNAWMELAHHYLYDNNPSYCNTCQDEEDRLREKNNYWYDVVSESKYYDKIDSLNHGDWEDWGCNWE